MMPEIIIVPVIFFTLYQVIRTLSNNNLRKRIIDRGIDQDQVKQLFETIDYNVNTTFASLKFGLIFIMIGLSFIVIESFQLTNEMGSAVIFIAVGLVLVIFSRIDAKK